MQEAYNEFSKTNKTKDIAEAMATISGYCVYYNDDGKRASETIAEAVSDVQCGGNDAKPMSLCIVKVLKKYLK